MVAALLDLHKGAGAAGELGDQVGGGLARLHDVDTADGAPAVQVPASSFSALPTHARHAGQRGPGVGRDLRGATGDDDGGGRAFALGAADGLAGLALGLGGDRAGVDDHGVGQVRGVAADDLALVGVQAAAEGQDLGGHGG